MGISIKDKSILILNSFLKEYTGSEIVTLELAEFFAEQGARVTVSSFCISHPLMDSFNIENVQLINLSNLESNFHYDIIWAHHFSTIEYSFLEKNISADKVIFSSLSHFTCLETPPLILDKLTHLLVNSIENKNSLVELGFNKDDIYLFPNPAPNVFFNQKYQLKENLARIAVVSNHIPNELYKAIDILKSKGIDVFIYGKGFEEVRITESILRKYDAVITIGKTVQYCLALGIPVYCYDRFGGVGWITQSNIKKASDFNFSGRDYPFKKKEIDIFKEIVSYKKEDFIFYKNINSEFNLKEIIYNLIQKKERKIKFDTDLMIKLRRRQQRKYSESLFDYIFCQLYFSKNGIFTETDSFKNNLILNSYNKVIFNMDCYYEYFRLDLSNSPAIVSSLKIICFLDNGKREEIDLIKCETSQIEIDNGNINIWGIDPQIHFQAQKNIRKIEVSFFIQENFILADYILDKKVNQDRQLETIKSLKDDINTIENEKLSLLDNQEKLESIIHTNENKLLEIKNENLKIYDLNRNLLTINSELNKQLSEVKNSMSYKIMNKLHKIVRAISFRKSDYDLIRNSALFDIEYYNNVNKDVQESRTDPIKHYMDYGWKEYRNPSMYFDTKFYLNSYPDVKDSGMNPLVHYLKYGKKEKRKISSEYNGNVSNLSFVKNAFHLVKLNPRLIKKFIFIVKQNGLSYALIKVKNKINKLDHAKLDLHQDLNVNLTDVLNAIDKDNINSIKDFYTKNKIIKPIDILIPVYNGFEFLDNLFASIVKNTSLPYRLIIGNDRSPDERVKPFIEDFIKSNPQIDIIFIDNKENLGFLKTVNLLSSYAQNHLVILNTDTEVPMYWLERLMYPILSNKDIASTTPFTNSGTICSFPEYLVDNRNLYKDLSLEQIDGLFSLINSDRMISVPTGVGFCMGMNFDVIKKIGMFDEIYGKGYGEENDWCQRAILAGFKNVHIPNLFVYHKHGGSFLSEDKKRYINEHYQILLNKFPTYDSQIQNTIKENKLESLRKFMKALIDFKYNHQENILVVDHDLGGGANSYRNKEISTYKKQGKNVILFIYNINLNKYFIEFHTNEYSERFNIEQDDVFKVIDLFKPETLLLNGLVSFPNVLGFLTKITSLKEKHHAMKLIFPVHDYFCISPNYTLLGERNKYEGVPVEHNKHSEFLKNSKAEFKLFCNENNAEIWQKTWGLLLSRCEEILCFSHSSEGIILTAYPSLIDKLVYRPHNIEGTFNNIYDENLSKSKKVIGILGNINIAKGSGVIRELVTYIETQNYSIDVVLIGNIDADINSKNFVKTGSYSINDVPELIEKYQITEFLIPSVWPETFSYTTDEIMQLGYPLSVFDLGAPAERVCKYDKGRILPLEGYLEILCKN